MTKQKKSEFKLPYLGVSKSRKYHLLFNDRGDFSVVIKMTNPVLQFDANPSQYENFHNVFVNIIKILGEGHIIQKQDILIKKEYEPLSQNEYLAQKYQEHFKGRSYTVVTTFLVITKQVKKGRFYTYDEKVITDFLNNISKVVDLLSEEKLHPYILTEREINNYVMKIISMEFQSESIALDNILASDKEVKIGSNIVRNISLINIDSIDLPNEVGSYLEKNDLGNGFPIDTMSFLLSVPDYKVIVYNQLIEIPSQRVTLTGLELKKKRHSGMPDPENQICVEDIEQLLIDVARENQMLVNVHYNIALMADLEGIDKANNYINNQLFSQGIIPSKNSYNQLELFRTILPGNSSELKKYDWFLTTSDAALCFFFKEKLVTDEKSDFKIYFTDRQGIPVAIDPADLPMNTNRINNRNKFVLGPSGSGKSFFMNALIEQYMLYNMDVVLVDTGHSYYGLCSYYNGKYITYTEQKPITMNPFNFSEQELNIEKKDFLKTLIALLWKGTEGEVTPIEDTVLSNLISGYFNEIFLDKTITKPSFNSFYDYSLPKIKQIKEDEGVPFDLDEFRYVLKKFYKGGEFEAILNEDSDNSLFNEPFIVFEIDSIKEHKILFPIVTLIIMDVFIQKMRHRSGRRKALIIEEAWKAIASKLMGGYILYLYKTVRKFWGEAVVVTQELGDIIGNAVVKDSILSNSDTICLLDQTKFKDNYDEIAKLLALTPIEKNKIFTINQLDNKANRSRFKEVYIKRGATGEVYGVEVSLHQYLTYTTERAEKDAVEVYTSSYGSYQDGLDAFVSDMSKSNHTLPHFVKMVNSTKTVLQ